MTITTRAAKGAALSHAELDTNFTDLRDGVALAVPSAQDKGLRVGSLGTPDFGWHDMAGDVEIDGTDPACAVWATYRGALRQKRFAEGKHGFVNFHVPHDYLMGSDLFIHVHWSQTSATLTGGSVTWAFETTYAKGHNQAAFSTPVICTVVQAANTTRYQHMIAETALSIPGGSGSQLNTNLIEVDGLIFCRMYLDSNDLTDSVLVPEPFVHFVDIHYQSTGVPTKNRAPDFWT